MAQFYFYYIYMTSVSNDSVILFSDDKKLTFRGKTLSEIEQKIFVQVNIQYFYNINLEIK